MGKILVAEEKEITAGAGKMVSVNGNNIGLFRIGKSIYAMHGICPHRDGPVGEGELEGNIVTCPWHGWQFDVTTGQNKMMESIKLPTYKVIVENGKVYLDI